jgi:hypothetical protein
MANPYGSPKQALRIRPVLLRCPVFIFLMG